MEYLMITTRMLGTNELLTRESILGPMIMEALATGQGERGFNDYADLLMKGEAQVWVVEKESMTLDDKPLAVCMTKFIHYPNYKALHIVALTGDDWFSWGPSAHERLKEFAQDTGCSKMEIWGRKGWEKALKKIPEYSHTYSVFSMEI